MDHQFANYCVDCEWSASTDQYTRRELSDLTVEHACTTGHDVEGKRLRGDHGRDADHRREQDGQDATGVSDPGAREPDRAIGEPRRVYSVSESYRDGANTSTNGTSDNWNLTDRTDGPTEALTRGDFEADLRELIRRGYRAGVLMEGCDVRFPEQNLPDCTIEIHELAGQSGDTDV